MTQTARIHILSDLHDDICRPALGKEFVIPDVDADLIVLAGDIDGKLSTSGRHLLERTRRELGKPIVVVAGNHDYWRGSVDREIERTRERLHDAGIYILDCDTVVIAGVRFVGATLWTDYAITGDTWRAVQDCSVRMNDFKYTRSGNGSVRDRLTAERLQGLHMRHRRYIESVLAQPFDGPTVVVTHHAPSSRSLQIGRVDVSEDHTDGAYASDLEAVMHEFGPALWIHGHVHSTKDYSVGATRVVSNPRGYTWREEARHGGGLKSEPSGFDPRKVVELPTPAPRSKPKADPMAAFRALGDELADRKATEGINVLRGIEPTKKRPK